MKKFALLYCLLFPFAGYTQSHAEILKYARQIVDTLASSSMHGRGYVWKGDSIAADYIKNEFEKWGLKPIQKEYYQKFYLNVNTFPSAMKIESHGKKLIPGKDFIVQGASGSVKGIFKIQAVNSHTLSSKKKKTKFNKTDFSNKVVLIDKHDFDEIEGGKDLLKMVEVNSSKAKAVIFVEENKLTAEYSEWQAGYPLVTMLRSAVNSLSDSLSIDIQNKYLLNYQTQNIIGYIPGTQYPDSFLIFSAHYDHLGMMGPVFFPGANDNASGSAMLLSLAKYYALHAPRYSLAFMAFGGEEAGLLGSKYYVAHPLFPLTQIKFLINMDMLGTGNEGIKVVNATEHKREFGGLVNINAEENLLSSIQPRGKAKNSDHYFFEEAGVPTFFIYTLGGIKAYHDIYDRPETLPLTKFEELFKMLTEFSNYLQK